jgi:hypothetical protein
MGLGLKAAPLAVKSGREFEGIALFVAKPFHVL